MKKNIIIQIAILIGVTSCFREEQCVDNVSAENKKVPYVNGQVVQFQNDTLGAISYTINNRFADFSDATYYPSSGDSYYDCGGQTEIQYVDFLRFFVIQATNYFDNEIGYSMEFDMYYDVSLQRIDYNGDSVDVCCFDTQKDTTNSVLWERFVSPDSTYIYDNVCFMVNPEIKLIEYTAVHQDGTRYVWRLVEE